MKRRSRNAEKHRSSSQGKLVDASTSTAANGVVDSLRKSYHRNHFGSELTLPDCHTRSHPELDMSALSECQSEADLRGYLTATEDEDDRSVVSDFHTQQQSRARLRSSSGNLAARLGILPENRTILDFQEAGNVFNTAKGLQIKTYGLIDDLRANDHERGASNSAAENIKGEETRAKREESPRKISHGQESGYGSDGATTNSSRASPRGSLDSGGDHGNNSLTGNSVRDKILAFQSRTETPSPPTMTKDAVNKSNPPLLMPKPSKSVVIPPKKPARTKLGTNQNKDSENSSYKSKDSSAMSAVGQPTSPVKNVKNSNSSKNRQQNSGIIDVAIADEDTEEEIEATKKSSHNSKKVINVRKEYKMVRLLKDNDHGNELGIIIAKKKLPDLQPPVTGFQVVHIEPRGLIDR